MSKKQKRSVTSNSSVATETVSSAATSAAPARRFSTAVTEFNPDYSHVIQGLKRIGGMVAFFVAAMIVLKFFIK